MHQIRKWKKNGLSVILGLVAYALAFNFWFLVIFQFGFILPVVVPSFLMGYQWRPEVVFGIGLAPGLPLALLPYWLAHRVSGSRQVALVAAVLCLAGLAALTAYAALMPFLIPLLPSRMEIG